MKSRRFWLLASSSVLLATPAFAQETPPSSQPAAAQTDDTGRSGGLADIVVTARRTSENLQSTPVAVTAVSAETLASRGSADITALQDFVPNVTFNPTASNSGSSNAAVIFIRGIGQSDFYPQVDPGVGVGSVAKIGGSQR
ncbi:TonB-dependent receptor plug domain-containing protein [Sphingopyxis indica]|uniref:TonB-dependent receptor plug domain-containing protein n=1 Tax=Sphingopyxis indica TaxID=436663 RepID=UPI00293932EE|nr:TonB-dependent receptor plug domain-containing protein [Sphingopyxis indica]WOF43271.1 TonB-dependent receptor plug domain-containing protein [Sphingopyxis indica]